MSSESLELCREKALRILEISPHSVVGLKRKLFKAGKFTSQDILQVIDDLLKAGLLNDRQFAEDYIRYLQTTAIGRIKAIFKLRGKGIPADIIDDAMDRLWDDEDKLNAMEKFRMEARFDKVEDYVDWLVKEVY